ncbi:MAG: transcriptional repressor, CopY family, partial [Acidobacteria bacterium]|nr:transcriptional repressor, CopY family [Acidobacteriota bacterium]
APEQDRWATDPLGVIAAPTTTHPLPQVVLTSLPSNRPLFGQHLNGALPAGNQPANLVDRSGVHAQQCLPMKSPRFLLRGFRRPSEVASLALGKLEQQVLHEAWRRGELSVREVFVSFDEKVAYTTLMTTLDRLYKKKLLNRRKDGRAFLYSPAVSEQEFEHGIREDVIDGLLGHGAEGIEPVLACIVDTVSERDREWLDELDRLVKEKKRQLRRQD